jgi:uncharacterized delta-60 repeat protein
MKKGAWISISLILVFALLLPLEAGRSLAPQEKWVARYNGPGNYGDWAQAIAVDGSGNVYVTGSSGFFELDYATVKYNANGKQLWVKKYNGPGNLHDEASAIAVDGSGNVYVTGESYGSGTGYDFATIKYNTNGEQLWQKRYDGPRSTHDKARAIAVDDSGNVYVAGESVNSDNYYDDFATVKYSTNGKQLWVKRYNGPGNKNDLVQAIAVDSSGNVYVTGTSYGSGTDYDYTTIKYSTNGKQLWVKRYDGPGNKDDLVQAIAVDSSGNIYVTGTSYSSGTDYDYATIKYSTDGKQLWVKSYNSGRDEARAIAVDGSGKVYVTGSSCADYGTVKYNTNGQELWEKNYNGSGNDWDEARAITVDRLGNVYVTGLSKGSGTDYDYATIKYSANGKQLWAKRYNGPGNKDDKAQAIALDGSGNIYITGTSMGSGTDYDYATIKY